MKARRVVLTVEVETGETLSDIRSAKWIGLHLIRPRMSYATNILQISANVIRDEKKRKGKR